METSGLDYSSLADVMSSQWGSFPKEWLNQTSIGSVRRLCEKLPPLSGFGVEIQCGQNLGVADISVRLQQCDIGGRAFAEEISSWRYPLEFIQNKNWQAISRFSRFWNAHPLTSEGHLPAAWLEFDASEWQNLVPNPCLFFGIWNINRDYLIKTKFIQDAHYVLTGLELPENWFSTICLLLNRSPNFIERCWIGYMLSRPTSGIRLTVLLSYQEIIKIFLDFWGSIPEELELLFDPHHFQIGAGNRYMVHFDCNQKIGPKIGIEIIPLTNAQHIHLAECGFIPIDELERIYRWCGRSEGAERIGGTDSLSQIPINNSHLIWTRQIGHYKFDFIQNEPVRSKVYLGASFAWA